MNKHTAVKIRIWLLKHGLNQAEIGRRLGIERSAVNNCIHGRGSNQKVLAYLIRIGVPEEILELPESFDKDSAFQKMESRLRAIKGEESRVE